MTVEEDDKVQGVVGYSVIAKEEEKIPLGEEKLSPKVILLR